MAAAATNTSRYDDTAVGENPNRQRCSRCAPLPTIEEDLCSSRTPATACDWCSTAGPHSEFHTVNTHFAVDVYASCRFVRTRDTEYQVCNSCVQRYFGEDSIPPRPLPPILGRCGHPSSCATLAVAAKADSSDSRWDDFENPWDGMTEASPWHWPPHPPRYPPPPTEPPPSVPVPGPPSYGPAPVPPRPHVSEVAAAMGIEYNNIATLPVGIGGDGVEYVKNAQGDTVPVLYI